MTEQQPGSHFAKKREMGPPETHFVDCKWESITETHRFCHEAMATTFEIIILHKDALYCQQAARAAFDKLDSLEAELSRFIENSDISRINNLSAGQSLLIGLDAFNCLELSGEMYKQTQGSFDVTIGTGMELLELDETEHTVKASAGQLQIDLGGIGKGYAIDRMAELLRQWSIESALINGGCSSVLALEPPPVRNDSTGGTKGWPVTLSHPANLRQLAIVHLNNSAISGSGLQSAEVEHIIDPRSARPVKGKLAAWAGAGDAATADALSTAFMIMSPEQIEQYCRQNQDVSAMVVTEGTLGPRTQQQILRFGQFKSNGPIIQ